MIVRKKLQLKLIYINWRKNFLTGSVLGVTQSGMPQKYADVSVRLEASGLQSTK